MNVDSSMTNSKFSQDSFDIKSPFGWILEQANEMQSSSKDHGRTIWPALQTLNKILLQGNSHDCWH